MAVEFSQGPHSLKLCHPAPGRDIPRVQQPGPVWAALHEPFAGSNIFSFFSSHSGSGISPVPLICPESLTCPWGMASPSALPGHPQLLSPPLTLQRVTACCQFPSAATGTLRQNCPFLAHFCNIWCSFPSTQGRGTQQEPCDRHQGWHHIPAAVWGLLARRLVGWSECTEVLGGSGVPVFSSGLEMDLLEGDMCVWVVAFPWHSSVAIGRPMTMGTTSGLW